MKLTKYNIQACCGRTAIMFKTDSFISNKLVSFLSDFGFKVLDHFIQAGILYVENDFLIISGPIGSDKLQVKCKKDNCEDKIMELENNLINL